MSHIWRFLEREAHLSRTSCNFGNNFFFKLLFQKKISEQKKKEQDDLNQLFRPVIGQKVSAGKFSKI